MNIISAIAMIIGIHSIFNLYLKKYGINSQLVFQAKQMYKAIPPKCIKLNVYQSNVGLLRCEHVINQINNFFLSHRYISCNSWHFVWMLSLNQYLWIKGKQVCVFFSWQICCCNCRQGFKWHCLWKLLQWMSNKRAYHFQRLDKPPYYLLCERWFS